MAKEMRNSTDCPPAAGTGAYAAVLGLEGASQAAASLVTYPVTTLGRVPRYNLSAGTTALTLTIMRGGILTSTNPSSTTLTLPTLATLGYTRNGTSPVDLMILYQRCGLGQLFINPATGVTITWNNLDPQYLAQYHPIGCLVMVADNVWAAG